MGARRAGARHGAALRQRLAVDLVDVPALPGLLARSLRGIFGALVRHAPRATRRELRDAADDRAPEVPEFLHPGARRHLRRLSHLRRMTVLSSKDNPKVKHWTKLARDAGYRAE